MSDAPSTVLVLRFSSVGDIVLTAPALETLARAWPKTQIVFVTKAHYVQLIAANPHVHDVVGLEPNESMWHFCARLRAKRPDALVDLHGKLRGKMLAALVPTPLRSSWTKRPALQSLSVRLRWRPYQARARFTQRYHEAIEKIVGRKLEPGDLRLFIAPEAAERVERTCMRVRLDSGQILVGMSPGALWPTKRWPHEHFAALARKALAAGCRVAVLGSAQESGIAASVVEAAPGAVDLSGRLSLDELGAFVKRCSAFVANDSGPMHMARALGVPTLALFGSTDPGQFDFSGHALMFAHADCAPCSLHGRRRCPRGDLRCLSALDPETAWKALQGLLHAGRRPILSA